MNYADLTKCVLHRLKTLLLPGRPFSLWLFSSSGSAASFLGILLAPLFLLLTTQRVIPLLCPGLTTDSFSSTKNTPGESQGVLDELLGISLGKFSELELSTAGCDHMGPISSVGINWLFSQKEKFSSVAFASIHGVNAPTVRYFRLPV